MSRVLMGLAMLWVIVGLSESLAIAVTESERASFEGLSGVQVAIEDLNSDPNRAGLTAQQ
jgi:hypothetical protein